MINQFEHCPACGGPLAITECACTSCQLQLRGPFRPRPFSTLSDDHLAFIRLFLRARGNLSEMEKVLGVSYPTIRNKLDEVNRALERAEAPAEAASARPAPEQPAAPPLSARQAILQQVAAGALPAAQALQKLRDLQGERS